jgi:hypothetical protein
VSKVKANRGPHTDTISLKSIVEKRGQSVPLIGSGIRRLQYVGGNPVGYPPLTTYCLATFQRPGGPPAPLRFQGGDQSARASAVPQRANAAALLDRAHPRSRRGSSARASGPMHTVSRSAVAGGDRPRSPAAALHRALRSAFASAIPRHAGGADPHPAGELLAHGLRRSRRMHIALRLRRPPSRGTL